VAADGSVWFQKPDAASQTFHLWRSQWRDGAYQPPVRVAIGPDSVDERDPAVAPDERFVVFSTGLKGGPNRLQIAFREGGRWGAPVDLGPEVNRDGAEGPHIGPGGCGITFDAGDHLWRFSLAKAIAAHKAEIRLAGAPQLFAAERDWPVGTDVAPAFSTDGRTVIFTHAEGLKRTLMISHRGAHGWSSPTSAPFSGTWRDIEPVMAPGGGHLVFISNRPTRPGGAPLDGFFGGQVQPAAGGNLWRVDRKVAKDGTETWGAPVRLPDNVNTGTAIYSPAVAGDGSVYFNQPDPVTRKSHIYRAQADGAGFRTPEPLPISDGTIADYDAAVAPNETFMIFSSGRAPATPGHSVIFITYRRDGTWTPPQPLGEALVGLEARLSPDLKTLYFSAEVPDGGATAHSRIFQVPLRHAP
jgi:hypothetical protein